MATQSSNHVVQSIMTKGVIGGSIALITKGILTDETQIIITTKKGRIIRRGGGAVLGGYYDKEYYKRLRRDLKEDDDEIELIEVIIRRKDLPIKYQISIELLKPTIEAELIKMDLIDENQKDSPKINIKLIEEKEIESKIKATLINKKKPLK